MPNFEETAGASVPYRPGEPAWSWWRFDSDAELERLVNEQRALAQSARQGGLDADNPLHRIYASPAEFEAKSVPRLAEWLYSAFERVFALLVLILSSPVMLMVWLVIKLDSPGSPIFKHARVAQFAVTKGSDLAGKDYLQAVEGRFDPDRLYLEPKLFRFVKFRSMYVDAKQRFPDLYYFDYTRENFLDHQFKRTEDPRVTRVGRVLRKLTLDELPNFWCVLVGDMRLVGPRPEGPGILPHYTPELMEKFTVKPGITGLAQINGRGDLGYRDTIAYDIQYVRERTIWMDLKIIVKTVWLVVAGRGAF